MSFCKTFSKQITIIFILLSGCIDKEVEDSCSEFVSYVCTCHSKNPKYSCLELKNMYQNANTEKQEECALQLDDLIYEDTKNNLQCNLEQPSQNIDSSQNKMKIPKAKKKAKKNRQE